MKRFFSKTDLLKITNLFSKRFVSLMVFLATSTAGYILFSQSPIINIFGVGEAVFLPLISQPLIYAAPNRDIYWEKDTAPSSLVNTHAVTVAISNNEYMYLVGEDNTVTFAAINEDGTLGDWSAVSNLPILPLEPNEELYGFSVTAVNGLIYVISGLRYPDGIDSFPKLNGVNYCAKVNSDGTFSEWEEKSNNFEVLSGWHGGVSYHSVVFINNRIYLIGGLRQSEYFNNPWKNTSFVISAEVDVNNECEDLVWRKEAGELPVQLRKHTAVAVEINEKDQTKQYIYVFGGLTEQKNEDNEVEEILIPTVYRAQLGDGGIIAESAWEDLGSFSNGIGRQRMTAVQSGDYIYVIGGTTAITTLDFASANNTFYRTKILNTKGEIASWETFKDTADVRFGHGAVASQLGRIYVTGWVSNTQVVDTIFWTPLLFFTKESNPSGAVSSGDQIRYSLTATSNNVRDIEGITITDTLSVNLELINASSIFNQNGLLLTTETFALPINQEARLSISVEVVAQTIFSKNSTVSIGMPVVLPQNNPTATPLLYAQNSDVSTDFVSDPNLVTIQRTIVPGKSCVFGDGAILSGTPRPKPTCTPTPAVTPTTVSSSTSTPSMTATPTETNTPVTPTASPIWVVNQATICYQDWCSDSNVVQNGAAPYNLFLPLISNDSE